MKHTCHWPECDVKVPPRLWGCRKHWYELPARLRGKILRTYVSGQEIRKDPSAEYVTAAKEVQQWIMENPPCRS